MRKSSQYSFSLFTLALLSTYSIASIAAEDRLDRINIDTRIIPQNELYSANIGSVATKVSTPLLRTPLSVTVVTEKQIQDQNALNIAGSLAYTSGLVSNYRGQNSELEIIVRGIGNKSDGGGVPTYLNGIAYQGSYEQDPFLLESINIIKGPSSVLYGQSNPGGLVDIVTKKAGFNNKNRIQFKLGTNHYYQAGLDVERTLNEQLAFRLVGRFKRLDWKERYVRQQGGTLSPSLTWKPSDRTKLTLYAFYQKQPKAGDRNFLMKSGTLDAVNGSKVPYDFFVSDPNFHKLSLTSWHIGSELSHQFNDTFTFRQHLRYSKSDNVLHNLVGWDPVAGKTEIVRKARIFNDRWHEFGVDNQLESKFATGTLKHSVLSGLEYKQSRYDLSAYLGAADNIDWTKPIYGISVTPPTLSNSELKILKQTGVYVQDQIEIGNLDLLFATRYDHVQSRHVDRFINRQEKQRDHKLTWRTGAIYNFSNGWAPYFSYSTSFQPEVGTDADKKALKPTTAAQYELGLKYQPFETLLLTTALFHITQKNLVNYEPRSRDKKQTGEIHTKGLELSLAANINENLSLIASYAYTKRTVKKDQDSTMVNKTPWGIPRHQGALWAKYRWTAGMLNGLNLGAGIRYTGTTQGNNQNTFQVPHYTLYDAAIGYDLSKINAALNGADIQLNVQNLTNKQYVSSCATPYACFYGTERTIALTFNYQW